MGISERQQRADVTAELLSEGKLLSARQCWEFLSLGKPSSSSASAFPKVSATPGFIAGAFPAQQVRCSAPEVTWVPVLAGEITGGSSDQG